MGPSLVYTFHEEDTMEEVVNDDNIMMEHLTSTELMMKFGTVWNYLVSVELFSRLLVLDYD